MSTDLAGEIASLGTYFAFQTHDEQSSMDGSWLPLHQLLDGSEVLASRYEQLRTTLEASSGGAVEFRVAASTGHLAMVARLLCPAFGALLLGRTLDLTRARWQPVVGGVMPLSFPVDAIGDASGTSSLLSGPIQTLTELTSGMSVSPKVLWGNVYSALNGAVMAAGSARPDLSAEAMALGKALGLAPGPDFRRTSCCLIYRIMPLGSGPVCGDCVLN